MPYDTLVDKEKLERTFTEIGDAIRLKRDLANPIDVEDMPLQISLIEGGGGGLEKVFSGQFSISTDVTSTSATNRGTIAVPPNQILSSFDDGDVALVVIKLITTPSASLSKSYLTRYQFMHFTPSNKSITGTFGVFYASDGSVNSGDVRGIYINQYYGAHDYITIYTRISTSYGYISQGDYSITIYRIAI